ncbi:MAG: molybdate ABC transporter permease subunit [Actinobacteria bacterium]|nr:molybdate ABC transporter permease subunit [Actinomycetota bacterium]
MEAGTHSTSQELVRGPAASQPARRTVGGTRRFWDVVAAVLTGFATAVLIVFIALPLFAIFGKTSPAVFWEQLRSPVALDALRVSLATSVVALVCIVTLGTPVSYLLGTKRFPGRPIIITLFELPLVLPPAVAGIALFAAFGRFGILGSQLGTLGIQLPFTWVAVVMAQAFVAMPFFVRQATAGFASVDPHLLGVSRTLGAGSARTFFRVAAPLAGPSLSAGAALAWARALGEFGATTLFAGSLQGTTQTLPLAIYGEFSAANMEAALAMGALMVALSGAILAAVKMLRRTTYWK